MVPLLFLTVAFILISKQNLELRDHLNECIGFIIQLIRYLFQKNYFKTQFI